MIAFVIAQLVAILIAVYADWTFSKVKCMQTGQITQRTLHGLQPKDEVSIFPEKGGYRELSEIAEKAKRRAKISRELHTLKGHVESVAKLKGLDIDTAGHHYTV